ncbi:DNA polymerase III subunit delta [Candidatus Parcubacteria bacterium]|nr:MAG: DNA polymerase III subunit delta [Candidatus Parcubacteria bacterium]
MIFFVWGTDSYLIREQLNHWVGQYKAKNPSGFSVSRFDQKNFEPDEFRLRVSAVSMFGEKKLIIFSDVLNKKDFTDKIFEMLRRSTAVEKTNEEVFVIFSEYTEPTGDKREDTKKREIFVKEDHVAFLLKKAYKSVEVEPLLGARLQNWILKEFTNRSVKADQGVIKFMTENLPNDLWFLSQEIEKLSLYSSKITLGILAEITPEHVSPDIFRTIDALASRDKRLALKLLHQHLQKGDQAMQLLTMLVFQFRNIYLIKKYSESKTAIPKNLGMHPFVQQKAKNQGKNFSLSELEKIYQKLFETDLAIKTGQLEPETALDLFVTTAC